MAAESAGEKDELTGLGGREAMEAALAGAYRAADDGGGSFSCAVLDVDEFMRINDAHGMAAGDEVLKRIAAALAEAAGQRGRAFRSGGDEFALVMEGLPKEEAFLLAEKARKSLVGAQPAVGGGVRFTVTIGVASYPDDAADAAGTHMKAVEALYRGKVTGRNRVCLARDEKMVTKTSHYTPGQLAKLRELAQKKRVGDAVLLREALNDLFVKYDEK